jgi:uncharacterized SAM-binding protein YcdF (DUF218 family)
MMKLSKAVMIFIPVLLIAVFLYTAIGIITYGSGAVPVNADAAIVLGAASYGNKPSPVFRERINHAIWLYQHGYVKKIIFTGARDSGNEPAASAVASLYASGRGVPIQDILGEDQSTTTEENLSCARDLAFNNGLRTFLIVSDPLHMKRAMMLAEELGLAARPAPTPTTRYRGFGSRILFLAREIYFYETHAVGKWAVRLARKFIDLQSVLE